MNDRIILHFDIDAFFAAVEVLENPSLKGKPVIVGGTGKRGVVSTASYEARAFGVRSAMSSQTARRLCPQGIFVSGSYERYKHYSQRVFKLMEDLSDTYEKVSIDEAYVDLTHLGDDAKTAALDFKARVKIETGLTVSLGLSYNKFLAKLASDWKKPNGYFEIWQDDAYPFLSALPIIKIHGLGKKSVERLNQVGIYTVSELQQMPIEHLGYFLGHSWAKEIYQRIRGIDDRPVTTHHERKSYGKETTFPEDVTDHEVLRAVVDRYAIKLLDQLSQKGLRAKTVTLKVKYDDFQQITRSHTLEHSFNHFESIEEYLAQLMLQIDTNRPVRLIGVSFSGIIEDTAVQLSLFDL